MNSKLLLMFICLLQMDANGQRSEPNRLVNTEWRFLGFIYESVGKLTPCPDEYFYTIKFKEGNRIEGSATVKYDGKYRLLKKDKGIVIKLLISKASGPQTALASELECRLNYSRYLGAGAKLSFEFEGDKLKIFSGEYVTMVFERIH